AKLERQMVRRGAADHELSEMDGLVVQRARRREVAQLVAAAVTLVLNMMEIEPDVPPASGHGAAIAVPRHHLLALAGRDGRGRPLRRGGIERAEVDGVAGGALEHGRIDLEVPAAAVLDRALTIGALLERDPVGGRAGPLAPASALAAAAALAPTAPLAAASPLAPTAPLAVRPAEHRLDHLVV